MTTDANVPPRNAEPEPAPSPLPVLGVLLIVAGLAFLAGSLFPQASIARLWPLFLLVPVAILGQRLAVRWKGNEGVLVPIGVLSYLAVFFLWQNFHGWEYSGQSWPHYLLAPALGLFLLFLATRNVHLLIPVTVLTVTALVFFGAMYRSNVVIAGVLIAAGVVLIASRWLRRPRG